MKPPETRYIDIEAINKSSLENTGQPIKHMFFSASEDYKAGYRDGWYKGLVAQGVFGICCGAGFAVVIYLLCRWFY